MLREDFGGWAFDRLHDAIESHHTERIAGGKERKKRYDKAVRRGDRGTLQHLWQRCCRIACATDVQIRSGDDLGILPPVPAGR